MDPKARCRNRARDMRAMAMPQRLRSSVTRNLQLGLANEIGPKSRNEKDRGTGNILQREAYGSAFILIVK